MSVEAIRSHAARARAWLFDAALPLWWTHGFDRANGLWHEKLSLDGTPVAASPRRARVQARQTAVYAIAGRLGWNGPWRDAVEAGVKAMLGPARAPAGGPVHLLAPDGAVLNAGPDLYDRAFFLFALAHAARALQRDALIGECTLLMETLERENALPQGGFDEGAIAPSPPRRQNPHMHLFEALLALHAVTGDNVWRTRADRMGALFRDKLFDRNAGVLPEMFDDAWSALPARVLEPGHHYEWAWLLGEWARAGGKPPWDAQTRLVDFAERHGIAPHGAVFDEIVQNVAPHGSRLWPNTERIKAGIALYERTGDTQALTIAAKGCDALFAYFDTPVAGLWRDRRLADGSFIDEPAPASSFYHIIVALSELLRIGTTLK